MRTFVSAAILTIAFAAPASAIVIPAAEFSASTSYQRIDTSHVAFGPSYANGFSGTGSAVITASSNPANQPGFPVAYGEANPFGVVSATAQVGGVDGWLAGASASTRYYLAVTGVDYSTIVPIGYIAKLSTEVAGTHGDFATGDANVWIDWDLGDSSNISFRASNGNFVGYNPNNTYSGTFRTHGSSLIQVYQSASAFTHNGGSAMAYADPYFAIDPDFLAAHPDAKLEFSANIENAPIATAVPEPATWSLMLAGFALTAGVLRTRRMRVRYA